MRMSKVARSFVAAVAVWLGVLWPLAGAWGQSPAPRETVGGWHWGPATPQQMAGIDPIANYIYADRIQAANPKAAKKHYEIAAKYGTGKLKTDAEDILYREYSESNADNVK